MSLSSSSNGPSGKFTRRQFIYTTALAAGATSLARPAFARARKLGAGDKLNIGVVGCGGKGASDIEHCSEENIIALCDVDATTLAKQKERHPTAESYQDWT